MCRTVESSVSFPIPRSSWRPQLSYKDSGCHVFKGLCHPSLWLPQMCTLGSFQRDNSLWIFIESFPRNLWRWGPSLDTAIAKSKSYKMENKGICPHFLILFHTDQNNTGAREPGTWWANTFSRTDQVRDRAQPCYCALETEIVSQSLWSPTHLDGCSDPAYLPLLRPIRPPQVL